MENHAVASRRLHDGSDDRKRDHEADAHHDAVNSHRDRKLSPCHARDVNQRPTIVRLMTDSALWPKPRVSVTAMASGQKECTRAHRHHHRSERQATVVNTMRSPRRSMKRPMPIANSDPISVAHRFSCA
jgi:hypothetical protein